MRLVRRLGDSRAPFGRASGGTCSWSSLPLQSGSSPYPSPAKIAFRRRSHLPRRRRRQLSTADGTRILISRSSPGARRRLLAFLLLDPARQRLIPAPSARPGDDEPSSLPPNPCESATTNPDAPRLPGSRRLRIRLRVERATCRGRRTVSSVFRTVTHFCTGRLGRRVPGIRGTRDRNALSGWIHGAPGNRPPAREGRHRPSRTLSRTGPRPSRLRKYGPATTRNRHELLQHVCTRVCTSGRRGRLHVIEMKRRTSVFPILAAFMIDVYESST